jgi:glycosyltransferase involved in cell wall biosynthesis
LVGFDVAVVDLAQPMKILCVIDSLGSGGAQRQMVNLVCGFKSKGHDVEILIYYPKIDFFRHEVEKAGVPIHEVSKKKGFSLRVVAKLLSLIKSNRFSVIISFLDAPNIYCELAKAISISNVNLIVSERGCCISSPSRINRLPHLLANKVVANSFSHAKWLRSSMFLKNKIKVIYNGYFIKKHSGETQSSADGNFRFLVIGRIDEGKNGLRLIQALIESHNNFGTLPRVSWIGPQPIDTKSLKVRQRMDKLLLQNPSVNSNWEWLGERSDVQDQLCNCDALIHVSLHEGLPNVVCEAFIAGRPVIASNVCDHPLLVEDGVRGFLCDPFSPESISTSINRFIDLTPLQRKELGENARHYAEENLTAERMVSDYESLFLNRALET